MYDWKHAILFCLLFTGACSDDALEHNQEAKESTTSPEAYKRAEVSYLNEEYARFRSKQVANVAYTQFFSLSAQADEFQGSQEISFELLNNEQDLTLDFTEGRVQKVSLNGKQIQVAYNNWFITIDRDDLKIGPQKLLIEFSHPYSKTGSGLYRSIDPEDGSVYVYSDLEPYDANRIFPAFDQPDIKATYHIEVEAPGDWQVITAQREFAIEERGERKFWRFPVSDKFSTYIFSLHAGPYVIWEDKAGDIPLRLLARKTLAEYVEEEHWFEVSRQGFEFFQNYFEVDYPFHKYDQLIVPDFNSGAMENVGAVTFSERFIKRGEYTMEERERIANVILHEMAHMWFGNLVTMRWWNGLWLNESFATYMAYLAATEATSFKRAWHSFYSRTKLWAYNTDEQVTNHPIELPVNNTDSGFANFDGITYGKGASVLKQLSYLIEPEVFRQGVSNYLRDKSFQNSELEDFMSSMSRAADRDLDEWTRQWLYTRGTNRLTANYQCEEEKITSMQIVQEAMPEDAQELREHRLQLGLYKADKNKRMQLQSSVSVIVNGASTEVEEVNSLACPDFIYPNYEDWGFAKIGLPAKELALLKNNINGFDDPMLRSMLWRNLWEAVRDAKLPLTDYAQIVLANISQESDLKTLNQVMSTIGATIAYLHLFQNTDNNSKDLLQEQFESIAWGKVENTKDNPDLQKLWFDHYASIVHSEAGLAKLKSLLQGENSIAGFTLDQDRRWALVVQLAAHAHTGIEDILEQELVRDPSNTGAKAYVSAQAAAPDLNNKSSWLTEIQDDNTELELAKLRAAMAALYPPYQVEFRQALLSKVLNRLSELDTNKDQQYLRFYNRYLIRGYCSPESNAELEKAIADNTKASLGTVKALRIALQEDQRCIAMKSLLSE